MDSNYSDVRNVLVDPKLLFAATTLVLAAGLGTCKSLGLGRRTQFGSQSKDSLLNASHQLNSQAHHHSDGTLASDKKRRGKDRRKRTPAPKLPKSGPLSPTLDISQSPIPNKKVIRQPSALGGARKQRQVHEESFSEFGGSIAESSNHAEYSKTFAPHNIPLPPSPRSASATSSPSTSTTPLTPPSIAVAQLPLPNLAPDSASGWHWAQTNDSANLKPLDQNGALLPSRGRKRREKSPGTSLLITKPIDVSLLPPIDMPSTPFPTLNTLPPPNTPLDAQIEFMRQQVESSRAHENAARAREDELLGEVQRAREEMDKARKDVEGLRWQLGEMSQREERVSALRSLHCSIINRRAADFPTQCVDHAFAIDGYGYTHSCLFTAATNAVFLPADSHATSVSRAATTSLLSPAPSQSLVRSCLSGSYPSPGTFGGTDSNVYATYATYPNQPRLADVRPPAPLRPAVCKRISGVRICT